LNVPNRYSIAEYRSETTVKLVKSFFVKHADLT
jgi:hypothetical protein